MNIMKRWCLLMLTLPLLFLQSCHKQNGKEQPNILFMMSDDHTAQAWGIYGGILEEYVENVHIERLAESGMRLDNLFCTNSICVPSRASILTGKYSHRNGVYTLSESLHLDSMNVAKLMQEAGYETAIFGKWHLKDQPAGFDTFMVLPGQGRYHNPILKTRSDWEQGGTVIEGFSADVIASAAINWLQSRDHSKPFFLMVHFKATHEPFDYPRRNASMYMDHEIPEPESLYDFGPANNGRTFTGQKLDILGD